MAEPISEKIALTVAGGTKMDAFVARPATTGRCPALIVLQEIFGVNPHIRDVNQRFAREGYVALAPELFHRTAPGFEGDYRDIDSAMPHMRAMTPEGAAADLQAALDWLRTSAAVQADRISVVGYCMGGRIAFLANAELPLRSAVLYYGGGIAPAFIGRASELHSPMLFFWGGLDKHIPPEQRAEVLAALKTHRKTYTSVEFSDADHGFFCDMRPSYSPRASREAWALTLAFLKESLASVDSGQSST